MESGDVEERTPGTPLFRRETLWPVAGAALVAVGLQVCKPSWMFLGEKWPWLVVWGLLVVVLVLEARGWRLRRLVVLMVGLAFLGALTSTGLLVLDLVSGGHLRMSPQALLSGAAIVWADNIIACSLLYWLNDGNGAGEGRYPAFLFPQMGNPDFAPPGWHPRYGDYLYLGFITATALSPADVSPLQPWAKMLMMFQSMVSVAIMTLVVARAVNVLP